MDPAWNPPTNALKCELDAYIAEQQETEDSKPGHYNGNDWWQLSDAEEEVFEIDRARFIRMAMTHHCYECFKDITYNPHFSDPTIEAARAALPQWVGTPATFNEFADFAEEIGGVTNREAHAIFCKMEFWAVRLGVMQYADER